MEKLTKISICLGTEPHVITWCRVFNDTLPPLAVRDELNFDPSDEYHTYKIAIASEADEPVNVSK